MRKETENEKQKTQNDMQEEIPNSRFQIPNSGEEISNSKFQISNLGNQESEANSPAGESNLEFGIWNLESNPNLESNEIANRKSPVCLTIAGVDPSGGAGVIADIKTFSAFGCFATAAIASLTFQNTQGVFGVANQTAETVRRQAEPVFDDFTVAAVKTGMLPTGEIIEEVARLVGENKVKNFVVDPVVRSTSGFDLIDDAALAVLIEKLFPLATVITPNIPEAERIAGMKIETAADIERAARKMQSYGAKNVLIKGGHLEICDLRFAICDFEDTIPDSRFQIPDSKTEDQESKIEAQNPKVGETANKLLSSTGIPNSSHENRKSQIANRKSLDFLFAGKKKSIFEADYIETSATHGTGCTLAAAIAANLALGKNLLEAVAAAKKFVTEAIRTAPHIGKGNSPINQLISV